MTVPDALLRTPDTVPPTEPRVPVVEYGHWNPGFGQRCHL